MYSGYVRRLQDLCKHLSEYPEARGVALQNEAIGQILSISSRSKGNMATQLQANEALAELGYQKPLHGKGKKAISILKKSQSFLKKVFFQFMKTMFFS